MSKKIYKLRVPIPAEGESFPEFISHGNLEAALAHGELFETEHEHFALHLEQQYGLMLEETVEVEDETPEAEADESESEAINEAAYPEDFPGREILIGHNVAYETAVTLDAEQLTAYKGIGPKTADEIIEFVANGGN